MTLIFKIIYKDSKIIDFKNHATKHGDQKIKKNPKYVTQ